MIRIEYVSTYVLLHFLYTLCNAENSMCVCIYTHVRACVFTAFEIYVHLYTYKIYRAVRAHVRVYSSCVVQLVEKLILACAFSNLSLCRAYAMHISICREGSG